MRILVLNQYFHPDASATSQLLTQLVEDLAEDHDITVVSGRPSYNRQSAGRTGLQRLSTVVVRRVWSTTFSRRSMLGRLVNYLTFLVASLFPALASPRPDVIMVWTDPPPIAAVGALVSRLRRAPLVFVCQDIVPESVVAAGELGNPLLTAALRRARDAAIRRAVVVGSIGEDMTRRLASLGVPESKICLLRNWADGSNVHPTSASDTFRSEHNWTDRFVIMHSGNMGMAAELDTLLDAVPLLTDLSDLKVALVGDGINKRRLEDRVEREHIEAVEFLPLQASESLSASLGSADVHLVTHRIGMEGYQVPSKLYGILAAGKACIALVQRDCDVARAVEEAGCGIVVAPGDAIALAAAIRDIRTMDRVSMGARARMAFEELYDRPIAIAAYRQMLASIASSNWRV